MVVITDNAQSSCAEFLCPRRVELTDPSNQRERTTRLRITTRVTVSRVRVAANFVKYYTHSVVYEKLSNLLASHCRERLWQSFSSSIVALAVFVHPLSYVRDQDQHIGGFIIKPSPCYLL